MKQKRFTEVQIIKGLKEVEAGGFRFHALERSPWMKISRFTEEQIIAALRSQISGEMTAAQIGREMGVSQATVFTHSGILIPTP
jgi:hypothetical protein